MQKNLKRVAVLVVIVINFMIDSIKVYLDNLSTKFDEISLERKTLLNELSTYINNKKNQGKPIQMVYICTHNSRRSHFGQIWAKVIADYYGVSNVHSYSGGTEATAFNANAINALRRIGFEIKQINEEANARYEVYHDLNSNPSICFSKVFDHSENPVDNFAAIMTCSDADENCPYIPGAELRIGTTYEDPKAFDNTALQDLKYDERCKQIALETLFLFSNLKHI